MKMETRLSNLPVILVFCILGIWSLPYTYFPPQAGLDPSWLIGLYLAAMQKLQFGKDVLFTSGPLGFLWLPTYVDFKLWAIAGLFTSVTHLVFLSSIAWMAVHSSPTRKQLAVLALSFVFAAPFIYLEYRLFLSAALCVYLVLTDRLGRGTGFSVLLFSAFLLAAASLLKFIGFSMSLYILAVCAVVLINKRKFFQISSMFLVYLGSLLTLWVVLGQKIANLPLYMSRSLQISSGYNNSMAIGGAKADPLVGILNLLLFAYLFVLSIRKKSPDLFMLMLCASGIVLLSFKHGFVRQDHVLSFFAVMLVLWSLIWILMNSRANASTRILLIGIVLLDMAAFYEPEHVGSRHPNLSGKMANIRSASSLILNRDAREETFKKQKDQLKKKYFMTGKSLLHIGDKSVDIFPWDIGLAYAYELNWRPRPAFQSYAAYTTGLDSLNARHFRAADAPDIVLFGVKSIDHRYPIFDEPETFRMLLGNYRFRHRNFDFAVLEKSSACQCGSEVLLSSTFTHFGKMIGVPQREGGYVFANIHLKSNWLGKILGIIFKKSITHISLLTHQGKSVSRFRLVQDTAKNGLFLSQYLHGPDDISHIFSGFVDPKNAIEAIAVDTAAQWQYQSEIRIDFFYLPADVKFKAYLPPLPKVVVFRPSEGTWLIKDFGAFQWGTAADIPVPADYDGDGTSDIAVFRPSQGTWLIKDFGVFQCGTAGDIPVPGDYNGDGRDDIAVFKPSRGTWLIKDVGVFQCGTAADIPVPGDYDGDGKDDIAVFKPSAGTWLVKDQKKLHWGAPGDIPVPGDYNGDGKDEVAVFRPSQGTWLIKDQKKIHWGTAGDIPLPDDYAGQGKTDLAVWRPSDNYFYIKDLGDFQWGTPGDVPIGRFVKAGHRIRKAAL
jgi:hypothetical protein